MYPVPGLGIIRKKPDIRYKDPGPLAGLPAAQSAILNNVATYVKPEGVLLYATCTLLERENSDVIQSFLDRNYDFTLEKFQLPEPLGRARERYLHLLAPAAWDRRLLYCEAEEKKLNCNCYFEERQNDDRYQIHESGGDGRLFSYTGGTGLFGLSRYSSGSTGGPSPLTR